MAEQRSRDVVDQTLSGGEPSLSDVPASNEDKHSAGGDGRLAEHTATTSTSQIKPDQPVIEPNDAFSSQAETGGEKDAGVVSMDSPKQSAGLVASRALELNGVAWGSDGGDDTASQGGSESDASRTDGRYHARAGSVKKPATFRPVSFAKFSVPKAPGTAAPPKVPEKVPPTSTTPLGTPQPTSRPRLVAKTTAGMRDSLSKAGVGGAKPGGSGPDPNQVWNKNRPVQATPPKHLTDEELKQQYGIHMTSRIQEDGGGTEAKWADIDDDEDDWAPETIEWTDGTKVTLTHNEPAPPPPDQIREESKELPAQEPTAVRDSTKMAAPKPTTSVGPNPTVLRLGANAERQAKAANILAKGMGDRVPSGSTSPAPPPPKSPWAALPPVERMSPVNPPIQVAQSRAPINASINYAHGDDARQAPLPPQEIAADDFNRAWRETAPDAPRELYNSRSGRYEPVADTRKPSWRHDQGPRAPAVLQRPSHEMNGPAEPSAAFQTHRSSHQDGMGWNRRRTSSNVSGGSGEFGRRMSFGRAEVPPRYIEGRRGSQVNGLVDPALMGREQPHFHHPSPTQQHARPGWTARPPAPTDEAPPIEEQLAPSDAPQAQVQEPREDPVLLQERIMKEKRLEARQRRLEQEEKEKAAKQERIRQKLAALGPAPDKPQRKDSIESRKPQTPTAPPATIVQSPPKPPVPEPSGEPKQYGMMKVHHPDSVKKLVAANERDRATEKPHAEKSPSHLRRGPSPHRELKREPAAPIKQQQETSPQIVKVDEHDAQWRGNLSTSGTYAPWSSNPNLAATSPSLNNPWKPFSSDRTLGNGIFEQSLGGFSSRELPLRSQLGLDQSAMPPQAFTGPPESAAISPLPSPETRHAAYDPLSPIGRPGPIGPPSSQQAHWQQDSRAAGGLGAWNNFHAVAAQREHEEAEKYRQGFKAKRERERAGGGGPAPVAFQQTWTHVRSQDQAGQRHVIGGSEGVVAKKNGSPSNPLTGLDVPVGSLPFSESHTRPLANAPVRSSRFFPQATEQSKRLAVEKHEYQRSPSPPPPEEISSHPVFYGGSGRPLVHLPNPRPVVKLPPKALAGPAPPPTFASMAAATPRASPAPVSIAMSWQEKINGLFGKKTPTQRKSALAVASATKVPLDVQLPAAVVSVSFPNIEMGLQTGDGDLAVQQVEEQDDIFEDREPGSLPGVRVPNMAPPAAWHAAPAPSQARLRAKNLRQMQVHSIEPYLVGLGEKDHFGHIQCLIRLPGTVTAKTLSLPKKAGGPNSRHRSSPHHNKPRKITKPRETSGSKERAKKSTASQPGSARSSSPRYDQPRNASWGPRQPSGSQ